MAGVKFLRRIQLGVESQLGTGVAATTKWRGNGAIDDGIDLRFVQEDVGYIGGVDRTYVAGYESTLAMDDTELTLEQLPYILNAGVMHAAGVKDGAGSGYVYTYTFGTTSQTPIDSYTIEAGDDQQEEEFPGAYVESFKISGKAGDPLMMSAVWKGRQTTASTYTGALSYPTVEEILFGKGSIAIDAVGGTLGATVKSNTLLGFELNCKTGWTGVHTADALWPSFLKCVRPELPIKVTFEHDGTSTAEKANWRAQTPVKMRFKWIGSAVTTGTLYSFKTLMIDVAGKWQKFDKLGEQNGNDIVTGTFLPRFNSTANLFAVITCVNTLSALP